MVLGLIVHYQYVNCCVYVLPLRSVRVDKYFFEDPKNLWQPHLILLLGPDYCHHLAPFFSFISTPRAKTEQRFLGRVSLHKQPLFNFSELCSTGWLLVELKVFARYCFFDSKEAAHMIRIDPTRGQCPSSQVMYDGLLTRFEDAHVKA